MRVIREVLRVLAQLLAFGVSSRRPAVVALVLLAVVVSAMSLFVSTAAPLALYPFL